MVKPFVGSQADVPSDATVLRVDYQSHRGAVLAEGINPWYSDIDTYAMTTSVIDEAVRRIIAVGGELERIAILITSVGPIRLNQRRRLMEPTKWRKVFVPSAV